MFPLVDLIISLGSMIIPPAFDFIKKKFTTPEEDTPERTAGSLATTKPEVLPAYIDAIAKLKEVGIKEFNRDVVGTPSQFIVDLRSAIRPIAVCASLVILILMATGTIQNEDGLRITAEAIASNWIGSRVSIR